MKDFESLVRRALPGQRDRDQAFNALVARFQAAVYRRAHALLKDPHLAQDATQETFVSAYQNLGQLLHPRAFPRWLDRLLATQCNRMRRRKSVRAETPLGGLDLPGGADPAALAERRDLRAKIRAAIAALPEHERQVVRLFYFDGLSQKEIAARVALPEKTVKSRLYSSRRRLARKMDRLLGHRKPAPSQGGPIAPAKPGSGPQASARPARHSRPRRPTPVPPLPAPPPRERRLSRPPLYRVPGLAPQTRTLKGALCDC